MCAHRFEFSFKRAGGQRVEQDLRHIALILDWPGAQTPRMLELDFDGLAAVREALAIELTFDLNIADQTHSQTIEFGGDPEDMEPDQIAGQLALVQRLRRLRKAFRNDDGANEAAAELKDFIGTDVATPPAAEVKPADSPDDSFESLLGGKRTGAKRTDFVSKLLADSGDLGQADHGDLVALCDTLVNDLVRQVIADESLRRAERSLRGIDWLATELELGESIALWLLPIDLSAAPDRQAAVVSAVQRGLSGADRGGLAALAVDAAFETEADIAMLSELAAAAQSLSTTLLCKAPPALTQDNATLQLDAGYPPGSENLEAAWQAFRATDQARHCGAVLPRFLLRSPYGARGEAVYLPGFEELDPGPDHEQFLWINPVYALVYLIGGGGVEEGLTIENLPMPIYDDGSGEAVMPCAEAYLTEADVSALHERGIMALQSYRNRNAITLSGISTIA
jgi:hypothetical protein